MAASVVEQQFKINVSVPNQDVMLGRYAHAVKATTSTHDTQIDFLVLDTSTLQPGDEPTGNGFVVARVFVANTNLRDIVKILSDQLETFEAGKRAEQEAAAKKQKG